MCGSVCVCTCACVCVGGRAQSMCNFMFILPKTNGGHKNVYMERRRESGGYLASCIQMTGFCVVNQRKT